MIKPLTAAEVKTAKTEGKDISLFDGFGLLLYVTTAGNRIWRFRYSHPITKKRQTYTIGRYPDFTLAEAREVREELRRLLARGIDPIENKKKEKAELEKKHNQSFALIAGNWLELKRKSGLRENSILNIERTINRHLIPLIGKMNVHEIRAPEIITALKSYADRPAQLSIMMDKANAVMNYAINTGVITSNPLLKINNAFPPPTRTPVKALPIEDLPDFIKTIESSSFHISSLNALLFQIITMVRPREACNAAWSEVDFDTRLWTIPATRMKGKREHVVPLSDQAIEVLERMKSYKCNNYIFFGAVKNKPITASSITRAIHRTSFYGRLTLHGFRSMWSTLLNEEGFNPDVIEAALAHKSGDSLRDTYNRTTYLEQREKMMQWVGDFFDSARRGIIVRSAGNKGLRVVNE